MSPCVALVCGRVVSPVGLASDVFLVGCQWASVTFVAGGEKKTIRTQLGWDGRVGGNKNIKEVRTEVFTVEGIIRNHGEQFHYNRFRLEPTRQ